MDFSLKGLLIVVGRPAARVCLVMGIASLVWAVVNERRMQRFRKPGVSYREVTLRRDGAWKRDDLFTTEGLAYQREAARWGFTGTVLLLLAILLASVSGSF